MAINAGKAEVTVVGKYKDEISSKAKKAFDKFKSSAQAAFNAAAIALVAFSAAMVKSIALANKQELAIAKLEGALRATGTYTKALSKDMQDMASAFQDASTSGDEEILELQALLLAMGATSDNIKTVTQASLDLAAGMGTNATGAALLFGKALSGDFGSLSRYGILVGDITGNAEKLAGALSQVEQKFGGQAQAQAETFGGKMKQVSNAFGDLLEEIGFIITKEKGLSSFLTNIIDNLKDMAHWVKENRTLIQGMGREVAADLQAVWQPFVFFLERIAQGLRIIAITTISVRAGFNRMVGDMEEFDKLMRDATDLLDQFKITEGMIPEVMETTEVVIRMDKEIKKVVQTTKGWNNAMADTEIELMEMKQALEDTFATPSEKLQEFIDLMNIMVQENVASASEAMELLSRKLDSMNEKAADEATAFAEFVQRVGQTTEDAMVRALQGTESGWESMRNVALSVIQDIQRAMIRSQIIEPLFGGGKDGGKGVFGTLLEGAVKWGSTYFDQNALGGQVPGGVPTIVGERGPELFTPSGAGSITPNNQMGGGQPITIVQHIEVGTAQTVRQEMMNMMPMFIDQAKQAIADERQRSPAFSALMGV